ncbi:Ltp family lipoprotein [Paeniglutamicibacter sp. ABSL32-1]|nr:Ltp family lipoprotein [Paeniglutamicibacter quisquiliarum]
MWVDGLNGQPAAPPEEFSANPYLYMALMPGEPAFSAAGAHAPSSIGTDGRPGVSGFSAPENNGPKKPLGRGKKIGIGVAGLVVLAIIIGSCGGSDEQPSSAPAATDAPTASPSSPTAVAPVVSSADAAASAKAEAAAEASAKAEADAKAKTEAEAEASEKAKTEAEAEAKAKEEAAASAKAEAEAGTLSQQNALRSAENYLDFSAFSRSGLINQLEFEDFSTKDATWAVDRVAVDWNEQAVKSAEQYLDYSSFSRKGLIDQLVFEGYTKKQAEYGVGKTGL